VKLEVVYGKRAAFHRCDDKLFSNAARGSLLAAVEVDHPRSGLSR
jgi:hypothetical protein